MYRPVLESGGMPAVLRIRKQPIWPNPMKLLRLVTTASLFALTGILAFAGDPTGTWKWSIPGRDGKQREMVLKLALKDSQLTGTISGFRGETPITDATFKDDQIAFTVVREFNGNKMATKYQGKLEGDAIKGTAEGTGRDGKSMKFDWNPTRAK